MWKFDAVRCVSPGGNEGASARTVHGGVFLWLQMYPRSRTLRVLHYYRHTGPLGVLECIINRNGIRMIGRAKNRKRFNALFCGHETHTPQSRTHAPNEAMAAQDERARGPLKFVCSTIKRFKDWNAKLRLNENDRNINVANGKILKVRIQSTHIARAAVNGIWCRSTHRNAAAATDIENHKPVYFNLYRSHSV